MAERRDKQLPPLNLNTGWLAAMAIEMDSVEPDRVAAAWTVGPQHLQPFGLVHGGVFCGVVETLCSFGAHLSVGPGHTIVGVENHTSFLRPVRSGRLDAVARPVHQGRTTQLWEAHVFDEQQRLVATGRVRLMSVPAEASPETRPAGTPKVPA
jgi:uncharacterized protein (TIGR00369 family)